MNAYSEITLKNIGGVWYSNLDEEFSRITYNDKTYLAIIPAEIVQPGLKFSFQKDPELHRQYFQHIPVRRLTVSKYEPQYLREVSNSKV